MITLYKYLRESIFDDEDVVSGNADIDIINNNLKELTTKLFSSIRGGNAEDICKIENKTLHIDAMSIHYGCARFDQHSLPVFKRVKEPTEIDCIDSNYSISISYDKKLDPSILCKTIKAVYMTIFNTPSISDMNFELYDAGGISSAITFYDMNSLDLKNITVNVAKARTRSEVRFECLPNISNCKFNNVKILTIGKPSLFNDETIKKKLNNFFDSKHEAIYVNPKNRRDISKRSSKWIKLKSTINNNNLEFVSSDNNKMFDISSNAKLSDIIDLKAFPDLEHIIIEDNNISVNFSKNGKESETYYRLSHSIVRLPNDPGWTVELYKRR